MTNCFEPHSSACYNFMKDSSKLDGEKSTVIITPTTIVNIDEDPVIGKDRDGSQKTTLVKWSCSLGKSCTFSHCVYSRAKVEYSKK